MSQSRLGLEDNVSISGFVILRVVNIRKMRQSFRTYQDENNGSEVKLCDP